MKNLIKVLASIQNSTKELSDEQQEGLLTFWNIYRKNSPYDAFSFKEELVSELGLEKYDYLVDLVKKDNLEYYYFDYFRSDKIKKVEKVSLLEKIFKYRILVKDMEKDVFENADIEEKTKNGMIDYLDALIQYAIYNNYSSWVLVKIMKDDYDVEEEVIKEFAELYDKNLLILKLNFIINSMKEQNN